MAGPATLIVQFKNSWINPANGREFNPGDKRRLPAAVANDLVTAKDAELVPTMVVKFLKHGTDNLNRSYDPGAIANIPQEYALLLLKEKPCPIEQSTDAELEAYEKAQADEAAKAAKEKAAAAKK